MTETFTPYDPDGRAFTPDATVAAQLDAAFAAAGVVPCAQCGRMTERGRCHPCTVQNNPPLHGYQPAPGAALRAVEAVWITPTLLPPNAVACHNCALLTGRVDALFEQNDALCTENSDLARQVVALKAKLGEVAAETRAERVVKKGVAPTSDPLALLKAEERVIEVSRECDTLRTTVAHQANRLAACRCNA